MAAVLPTARRRSALTCRRGRPPVPRAAPKPQPVIEDPGVQVGGAQGRCRAEFPVAGEGLGLPRRQAEHGTCLGKRTRGDFFQGGQHRLPGRRELGQAQGVQGERGTISRKCFAFRRGKQDEHEAFESLEAQQPGKSYQAIPKRVPRVRTVNTEGQMVAPVLRTRGNPGHPALGRSSARRAWPRALCRGPGKGGASARPQASLPVQQRCPGLSAVAPVGAGTVLTPTRVRPRHAPCPARIHIGGDPRRGSPPGVFR